MPDAPPRFSAAHLKLEWAHHHIRQTTAIWEGFLQSDFYEVVSGYDPDSGTQIFKYVAKPGPIELLLAAGDAIHNTRAALDYVISEILGWKDTRLNFPMAKERDKLVDTFRTEPQPMGKKTKGVHPNAKIESAAPGLGNFIVDEIRPYKGGNEFLWPLNRLDNRNKHRNLILAILPQEVEGIEVVGKTNPNFRMTLSGSVSSGGVINFASIGPAFGELEIKDHGKATAEIFIDETGVIERQPLFPTLVQMRDAVGETITGIDNFLTEIGWGRPSG